MNLHTRLVLFALSSFASFSWGLGVLNEMTHPETNWERFGGTYNENHYSALTNINSQNIDELGLAWHLDLETGASVGASSPVAVDGIIYFSAGYSVIHAVEAKTGKVIWKYDPKVFDHADRQMRSGWGVRGIAYADGKVITATLDGRLIAIDRLTGKEVWTASTTNPNDGRYITGAPYVIGDKVVIGHGGADYAPIRGYVTAYKLSNGEQQWRFYTVPGNPADGFENDALAMAAKTWTGEWWKHGGGGTVWNAMAYDPDANVLFIGVGNGAPWNQKIRSPGGGDNLFLCSIVALDADTGEYLWHYQINPGESWDYNASMDIVLADLTTEEGVKKVILHAPKNGFFYVIERTTGKLISAKPFTEVNWAKYIDQKTGRPVENPEARYPDGKPTLVTPGAQGAHGVESMSYSPQTGLVYLPARDISFVYQDPSNIESWRNRENNFFHGGIEFTAHGIKIPEPKGWLAAWDPISQSERWRVDLSYHQNGGTLATAGGLVFQGQFTGEFSAYDATSGEKVWRFDAQNGIMGHPITYTADGIQYISVLVGWRESNRTSEENAWPFRTQKRRLLTFKIGGNDVLPADSVATPTFYDHGDFPLEEKRVAQGKALYNQTCTVCHGSGLRSGGAAPELSKSPIIANAALFKEIVKNGLLKSRGMPQYRELTEEQIISLRQYIIYQTNELRQQSQELSADKSFENFTKSGHKMSEKSKIDFMVKGDLANPCILFIHELGGSLNSWQWLDPELGENYCRIYINIPESAVENGNPLAPLETSSEEIKLLLDELGLERVHLIGAAYGSITSVYFSALHPEKVDRLVLMALGPDLPESVNQYILDRADVVETEGMLPVREMSLKNSFTQEFREKHPEIISAYERYFAALSPKNYVACSRALANLGDKFIDRLGDVSHQALVIGGALDPAFSIQDHQRVAHLLRTQSEPIILDGIGHFPHIESPSKVARIILDFLGEDTLSRQ